MLPGKSLPKFLRNLACRKMAPQGSANRILMIKKRPRFLGEGPTHTATSPNQPETSTARKNVSCTNGRRSEIEPLFSASIQASSSISETGCATQG